MTTIGTPIYLQYRLRLQSPAIVSTLSGDPNGAATQPFIPGGTMRGVLASRLLASGVSGDSEDFRRLVLSGDVRYLHAYPELVGERSIPSPSLWKSRKDDKDSALDLAAYTGIISTKADPDDFDWPEEALATLSDSFSTASGSAGTMTRPRMGSRLHQQRDRIKGRPWTRRTGSAEERQGVVFPYEYLEAEQAFRGIIQIMPAAAEDIERIKGLLSAGPILLGRSRRAGYGGEAEVEFTGQAQREYENVSGAILQDIGTDTWFRVLLTSAYVGRNPTTGQIDPNSLQTEICRRLDDAAMVDRTRWAFETVGAFNQKWRLEVPQVQAVAGGAVLVLKATSAIPVATLRAIEHKGLGERRVEGFGRVLFLEHSDDHKIIQLKPAKDQVPAESGSPRKPGPLSERNRQQLDFVERRIVLAAARAELDRVATLDLAAKADGKLPTNSLLGRIRTLFRTAMDEQAARAALANLRIWCCDDDVPGALKKNAREQLDHCRIGGESFCQWLRRLADADHGEAGWRALIQASENQATLTGLAARSHLSSRAAAEAVLHAHSALLRVYLIDAVLGAMALLNRRGVR